MTIAVTRPGDEAAPCVTSLTVSADGADIGDTAPLWEVSTADPDRCLSLFTYGSLPAGYAEGGPARPLVTGRKYLAEVSGPGLRGGETFTARSGDGPLS